jgi:NAD(P)-dependent dehydrogenase (short-subunit alcohol dehydrogenase family)
MVGMYHASKWALEGISQSLAAEVAGFGIKVTLIEPGGFSTDWGGSSARHAEPDPAYDDFREQVQAWRDQRTANPGDPSATGAVVLQIVDAEEPPLRVFFGEAPLALAKADYESRLATWEKWQPLSVEAQGAAS